MIDLNFPWKDTKEYLEHVNIIQKHGWRVLGLNVYCQCDKGGISDVTTNLPSIDNEKDSYNVVYDQRNIVTTIGRHPPLDATIIRRVTIMLHDGFQPNSVSKITESQEYDVVAIMPTTQKTFHAACENINCDLINLDYYCHCVTFKVKRGMVMTALNRGCFFEITMSALEYLAELDVSKNTSEKSFRARLSGIIKYIPLKRLVLSPGHNDISCIVSPTTFIGMCNELLSNAVGTECDTRDCVMVAPKGCISKGAARRTYGTGILVHQSEESLGKKYSALATV